jgi:hypothetical protein
MLFSSWCFHPLFIKSSLVYLINFKLILKEQREEEEKLRKVSNLELLVPIVNDTNSSTSAGLQKRVAMPMQNNYKLQELFFIKYLACLGKFIISFRIHHMIKNQFQYRHR